MLLRCYTHCLQVAVVAFREALLAAPAAYEALGTGYERPKLGAAFAVAVLGRVGKLFELELDALRYPRGVRQVQISFSGTSAVLHRVRELEYEVEDVRASFEFFVELREVVLAVLQHRNKAI